jgi:imidazole glycerol-phosphate synthase subunit HisH
LSAPEVTVVDYGLGNLFSVRRALEHCGATVTVTFDPDIILASPRVILPGVGAFASGMAELRRKGLDEVVREVAKQGNFLLGICLGMQMLLDESEEFGINEGLGLIPGVVLPIPVTTINGYSQKIPHIGWNSLVLSSCLKNFESGLLRYIKSGEAVYFAHSFMANPSNPSYRLMDCVYGGRTISSIIQKDNLFGCQFHPEKSGEVGFKVLQGFLSL